MACGGGGGGWSGIFAICGLVSPLISLLERVEEHALRRRAAELSDLSQRRCTTSRNTRFDSGPPS
jgi:hypothetical protein